MILVFLFLHSGYIKGTFRALLSIQMIPEIANVAKVIILVLLTQVLGVRRKALVEGKELPDAEQDHGGHEDLLPRLQVDLLQGDREGIGH